MSELFSQLIERFGGWVSPWIYGPIAVAIWFFLLIIIKQFVLSRLKKFVQKTATRLDDLAVNAAQFPLTLVILSSSFYLLQVLLPLSKKQLQAANVTSQGCVILAAVIFFDRLIRGLGTVLAEKTKLSFAAESVMQVLIRTVVFGLGGLIFLDTMGISITPLLASLGIGSLAVGLALQDTLANFFAGIYISVDRPIRVGDFVKLETGDQAYVKEIGWRSTRVQLLSNNTVIVPNQKIIASIITNYYLPDPETAVLMEVSVSYDSDLEKVEKITVEVARDIMKRVSGAVPKFEPFVRYHTFSESGINFTVILRAKEFVENYLIKHEFIKALHSRYQKEGISIPFRTVTVDLPKETLEALKR